MREEADGDRVLHPPHVIGDVVDRRPDRRWRGIDEYFDLESRYDSQKLSYPLRKIRTMFSIATLDSTHCTPAAAERPDCADCAADLEHCHDVSIEHADGTTECLADCCEVRHELHDWQLSCAALDPPCPCAAEER